MITKRRPRRHLRRGPGSAFAYYFEHGPAGAAQGPRTCRPQATGPAPTPRRPSTNRWSARPSSTSRRRHLPGRPEPDHHRAVPRRAAGCLSQAARAEPVAVHVLPEHRATVLMGASPELNLRVSGTPANATSRSAPSPAPSRAAASTARSTPTPTSATRPS
jgi:hypothetical protein